VEQYTVYILESVENITKKNGKIDEKSKMDYFRNVSSFAYRMFWEKKLQKLLRMQKM